MAGSYKEHRKRTQRHIKLKKIYWEIYWVDLEELGAEDCKRDEADEK